MIAKLTALACVASVAMADQTCQTMPRRSMPGRDTGSFGNGVCSDQITNCAALCQNQLLANTCDSNNGGEDNPFAGYTYCYECTCADGSTPDLASYHDTIPDYACSIRSQNCFYGYNQFGGLPPDGACPTCGDKYAVEPAWMPFVPTWSTTSPDAAATTAGNELTADGTPTITSEAVVATTSTSSLVTSTAGGISSLVTSTAPAVTTSSVPTTFHSTNTTTTSTRKSTTSKTSTSSLAPTHTAGAGMLEPAMAVLGVGMMAVLAL